MDSRHSCLNSQNGNEKSIIFSSLANYVFIVEIKGSKHTVRLSTEKNAYNDTVRLLGKLPTNKRVEMLYPVIYYSTYFPFLTASAMAKKLSDFMIARPCLSSPSTTS